MTQAWQNRMAFHQNTWLSVTGQPLSKLSENYLAQAGMPQAEHSRAWFTVTCQSPRQWKKPYNGKHRESL